MGVLAGLLLVNFPIFFSPILETGLRSSTVMVCLVCIIVGLLEKHKTQLLKMVFPRRSIGHQVPPENFSKVSKHERITARIYSKGSKRFLVGQITYKGGTVRIMFT